MAFQSETKANNIHHIGGFPNPQGLPPISKAEAAHEAWINEQDATSDAGIGAGRGFLKFIGQTVDRINDKRTKPNLRKSQWENEQEICKFVDEAHNELGKRAKETRLALEGSRRTAEAELETARGLKVDATWASSILAHFKSLPDGDRVAEVGKALEANDKVTLAVILKAPSALAGLTAEQQANFQRLYDRRYCAPQYEKLEKVANAESRVRAASEVILPMITEGYAGTERESEARQLAAQVLASRELAPPPYLY